MLAVVLVAVMGHSYMMASLPFSVVALIAAACGVAGAFVGKAKKDWKVWGAVCVACVLVSALALRVVFYMTGISIYPFF